MVTDYFLNSPLIVTILKLCNLAIQSARKQAVIIWHVNPQMRHMKDIVNAMPAQVINMVRTIAEVS